MKGLSRACLIYAATFIAGFCAVSLLAYYASARFSPDPSGELYGKYLHVTRQPERYDLVFLGDSRAFCAVHPDMIDPALGTRSFNLAHWTNWLPTQYPLARDLAARLPRTATAVLFVGHINFIDSSIYDKYPITLGGVPEYLEMGFPLHQLWDNLASFNPLLRFSHKRDTVRTIVMNGLNRPWRVLDRPSPSAPAASTTPFQREIAQLNARPEVARVEVIRDGAAVTSIALHKNTGSYERREIDSEFFRNKQAQHKDAPALPPDAPDERYVELFTRILAAFKEAGIRLIVVELEEAPYIYGSPKVRQKWRDFVRATVRPITEEYGVPYVTLPLETIPDSGYFDYDHMNAEGIRLFTPMLIEGLAAHLPKQAEGTD